MSSAAPVDGYGGPATGFLPLSATDYHLLLVLAERELYGYAIQKAMRLESGGAVAPEIGSLYRTIGRLVEGGLVAEAGERSDEASPSPGRPRRYYRITALGREVLALESARLRDVLSLAAARDVIDRIRPR